MLFFHFIALFELHSMNFGGNAPLFLNVKRNVLKLIFFVHVVAIISLGEHVQNGDHSDAHISTLSHSSKEVRTTQTEFQKMHFSFYWKF